MKTISKYLFVVVFSIILFSCEKDFAPDRRFIGVWKILTPDSDTLFFSSESSFSRKTHDGIEHSFEYSYDKNNITIQYKGPNMILVQPSIHSYEIKNNELFIDFTDGCYGFESETYNFTKIE